MKLARAKPSEPWVLGCFLQETLGSTNGPFSRLEVALEQMRELANLVLPDNADADRGGTLTVLNVILEKIDAIEELLRAGFSRYAPPRKVELQAPRRSAGKAINGGRT